MRSAARRCCNLIAAFRQVIRLDKSFAIFNSGHTVYSITTINNSIDAIIT